MIPSEFLALVEKMRGHQRAWFRNRQQDDLIASKTLERAVDKAIAEVKNPPPAMLPSLDAAPVQIAPADVAEIMREESAIIADIARQHKTVRGNAVEHVYWLERAAENMRRYADWISPGDV